MVDPSGLGPCDEYGNCGGGGGDCPECGPPIDPGCCSDGSGPVQNLFGTAVYVLPPIALPGQPLPGTTPSTFPTGPGVDWTSILFGAPNPALLIFNFCINKFGVKVGCNSPDAYANCGESESCASAIAAGTFIGPPVPPCFYGCLNPAANNEQTPWFKTCTANAVGKGLLSAGIGGIGLIPEGGLISRPIGNLAGWRGIVATQQGTKSIQAFKFGTGIASTGNGSNDTSLIGTGKTLTGIVSLLPGVGTIGSAIGIGLDVIQAGVDVRRCF
jgi:hypothetical protein